MCLKSGEFILNLDQIIAVVVFLINLCLEAVVDATVQDVRVVVSGHLSRRAIEGSSVLTELLNVLLAGRARLVDGLATLAGRLRDLLTAALDLTRQAFEDGQDSRLDGLCCFIVRLCESLVLSDLRWSHR